MKGINAFNFQDETVEPAFAVKGVQALTVEIFCLHLPHDADRFFFLTVHCAPSE